MAPFLFQVVKTNILIVYEISVFREVYTKIQVNSHFYLNNAMKISLGKTPLIKDR